MTRQYNNPVGGDPSNIGDVQFRTDHYYKRALIEAAKDQYFMQTASVREMPKNMGQKITQYHYMPLLDDRNINDQGIDAQGATILSTDYFVTLPALAMEFVDEADATAAVAAINAVDSGAAAKTGAETPWTVTVSELKLTKTTEALSGAVKVAIPNAVVVQGSGNLYGSSKDVGFITSKLPLLSENGGRKNRVGFKRLELEGSFEKFGFFDEYTQASLDFDTDAELDMHVAREMVNGASQITEAALQSDLLNSAGVVRYTGEAIKTDELTGEGTDDQLSVVNYEDLMKLAITLYDNRTPKHTKIITGSRMVDTRTINSAMYMYMGSELLPTVRKMKDHFKEKAFISIEQYGAAGDVARGEIGTLGDFRLIQVPEMQHWAGAGAVETEANKGYRASGGRYDVFPMLVVGDSSFTTIGFQTNGKTVKFDITHKRPGKETASRDDPYGETGFMSIKWFYGFMVLRSERIALIKTLAEA